MTIKAYRTPQHFIADMGHGWYLSTLECRKENAEARLYNLERRLEDINYAERMEILVIMNARYAELKDETCAD